VVYKQQNSFPTVLEASKSKIKVPMDLVSGEDLLAGSQTTIFGLGPHMAGRAWELCGIFYKGTSPIYEGFALMP